MLHAYGLAYRYAKAKVKRDGDALQWQSRRTSDGAELRGTSTTKVRCNRLKQVRLNTSSRTLLPVY